MDAHAQHAPPSGAHHEPHVLPLGLYLKTWGALLILTGITVGASYVDFGSVNLWIALGIATVKALLVAAIFMHLRYDHKFHSVILGMAVVFTVIFVGFTMFDTLTRGRTDAVRGDRPIDVHAPFEGTRSEEQLRERAAEKP
jgi:cytochrome c oxidase subunit 4